MTDMIYMRLFTRPEGESMWEDVAVGFTSSSFAPRASPIVLSDWRSAERILGWRGEPHPTPQRQFLVFLAGSAGAQASDGEVRGTAVYFHLRLMLDSRTRPRCDSGAKYNTRSENLDDPTPKYQHRRTGMSCVDGVPAASLPRDPTEAASLGSAGSTAWRHMHGLLPSARRIARICGLGCGK